MRKNMQTCTIGYIYDEQYSSVPKSPFPCFKPLNIFFVECKRYARSTMMIWEVKMKQKRGIARKIHECNTTWISQIYANIWNWLHLFQLFNPNSGRWYLRWEFLRNHIYNTWKVNNSSKRNRLSLVIKRKKWF